MTFDLDIVADQGDANMQRLVEALEEQGFRPRLPVALRDLADSGARRDWVEERNLIAFTLTHPQHVMEELDVILSTPVG